MRTLVLLVFIAFSTSVIAQGCITLDSWTETAINGDGTCDYDVTVTVDSGNGASGTATITLDGMNVQPPVTCTCNPQQFMFSITVPCGSTIDIDIVYDAPGMGNDCTGSTGPVSLPIEWQYLDIVSAVNANTLKWSTTSEINNDRFEVEVSNDGVVFDYLGSVKGAGNSSEVSDYSYLHKYPQSGVNFYRIKQVDFDGMHSYSRVLKTDTGIDNEVVEVGPNPFTDNIYLGKYKGDIAWQLLSMQGQLLSSGTSSSIETSFLSSGPYVLIVSREGHQVYRDVVVKL